MLDTEYQQLLAAKKLAVQAFDKRKRARRQKIADAILSNPTSAIRKANQALKRKDAPWQQWSKIAWQNILRTKPAAEIAEMLVHPTGQQEALADSHPFAGLTLAKNGR
jgi:hypothetical protein